LLTVDTHHEKHAQNSGVGAVESVVSFLCDSVITWKTQYGCIGGGSRSSGSSGLSGGWVFVIM